MRFQTTTVQPAKSTTIAPVLSLHVSLSQPLPLPALPSTSKTSSTILASSPVDRTQVLWKTFLWTGSTLRPFFSICPCVSIIGIFEPLDILSKNKSSCAAQYKSYIVKLSLLLILMFQQPWRTYHFLFLLQKMTFWIYSIKNLRAANYLLIWVLQVWVLQQKIKLLSTNFKKQDYLLKRVRTRAWIKSKLMKLPASSLLLNQM